MKIGCKVRMIRTLKGFSQSFMAEKLNLSQEGYSYIENKQKVINNEMIKKIADLLEVTIDEIQDFNPNIFFNHNNSENATGVLGYNINYSEKESLLIKNLIESMDKTIELLEKTIMEKDIIISLLKDNINLKQDRTN
jgi:transcriptional regulator with XRE-family HTH domain